MAHNRSMVLNRNFVLESTLGHVLRFEKNKPIPVPPVMYGLALGIGAEFTDDKPAIEEPSDAPQQIFDPALRRARLLEIVTDVFKRNQGDEFTAGGKPKASVVSKAFGFEVSPREVAEVVQAYYDAKAAG